MRGRIAETPKHNGYLVHIIVPETLIPRGVTSLTPSSTPSNKEIAVTDPSTTQLQSPLLHHKDATTPKTGPFMSASPPDNQETIQGTALKDPHRPVEGPLPTVSHWAPVRDEMAGSQGAALAVDESALPEPMTRAVNHSLPFRVPRSIYQHFCRAPPSDAHIAAMHKQQGIVANSTVVEHCRMDEGLF